MDYNSNGPFSLDMFSSANTVAIDAGDQHTMLLTKKGELWSVGNGSQTGISPGGAKLFTKICNDKSEKISNFSCGSNFSIFVNENNELYGVGSNNDGRCGLNYNNGSSTPTLIEFPLKNQFVKQISCGQNHSLLLLKDGKLYVVGNNDKGQLGIVDESGNNAINQTIFRNVNELNKKTILMIAAGQNLSLILCKEKSGKTFVMACGEKSSGRLGLGSDSNNFVSQFTVIKELKGLLFNLKIKSILIVNFIALIYCVFEFIFQNFYSF